MDLACPVGNWITTGSHTPPRPKNPGWGDTPGPTGMPANTVGDCPWSAAFAVAADNR